MKTRVNYKHSICLCIVTPIPEQCQHVFTICIFSEIYSKIGQNDVVQARPSVVHFAGFEVNKTHTQKLFLINVATEVHRMDVIPPQTKYFYIKYTKQVSNKGCSQKFAKPQNVA